MTSEKWNKLSLIEQIANLGSEVERALNWRSKNTSFSKHVYNFALELMDLTLDNVKGTPRFNELLEVKQMIIERFKGQSESLETDEFLRKYFYPFMVEARKDY